MFAHLDTDNDELLSSAELYALRKYSVYWGHCLFTYLVLQILLTYTWCSWYNIWFVLLPVALSTRGYLD